MYETPKDLTSARSELHNLSCWLAAPVTKEMLEALNLAAAALHQVAEQPLHELAQRTSNPDNQGNPVNRTFAEALIYRNELLPEARGLSHLQRLIDTRLQILNETIAKYTNA